MKSFHRSILLSISCIIGGAAIRYVVTDLHLRSAREDLAAYEEESIVRSYRAHSPDVIRSDGSILVPIRPRLSISREDRARIEELKSGIRVVTYQRMLAGRFFGGGLLFSAAFLIFSMTRDRKRPNQALEPTITTVTSLAAQEPRRP